jgi:hypothetical protein
LLPVAMLIKVGFVSEISLRFSYLYLLNSNVMLLLLLLAGSWFIASDVLNLVFLMYCLLNELQVFAVLHAISLPFAVVMLSILPCPGV